MLICDIVRDIDPDHTGDVTEPVFQPLNYFSTWRAWGYRAFFRAILGFLRLGLAKDGINFFICARMKYS